MTKHYRVKKNTFLWAKGAILKREEGWSGYKPVSDIWDMTEENKEEYITKGIIENSPDYFERVYSINLLTEVVYKLKEEAREILTK